MGMLAEFREFVQRGNVVDMAVGVIMGAAFGKIVTSAGTMLDEVVADPDHPMRHEFDRFVAAFIEKLRHSSDYAARAEQLKQDLLRRPELAGLAEELWQGLRAFIEQDMRGSRSAVRDHMTATFVDIGRHLASDPAIRMEMNHRAMPAATRAAGYASRRILRERRTVGQGSCSDASLSAHSRMAMTPDALFLAFQEALAGRYSIDRELGRGGMGVVYLAREVHLDRPVAIKLLPPDRAKDRTLRDRRGWRCADAVSSHDDAHSGRVVPAGGDRVLLRGRSRRRGGQAGHDESRAREGPPHQ